MRNAWIGIVSVGALGLAGCSGGSEPASGGSESDRAAAESYRNPTTTPPAEANPGAAAGGDPNTGTGAAGIRDVNPSTEGDRN